MANLETVFKALRTILEPYAEELKVEKDTSTEYTLNTRKVNEKGRPVFFAMVRIGKGKVTYHFMPAYCYPDLLDVIGNDLRKRMQGKSCFNFKNPDSELFEELDRFTRHGFDRFLADGRV